MQDTQIDGAIYSTVTSDVEYGTVSCPKDLQSVTAKYEINNVTVTVKLSNKKFGNHTLCPVKLFSKHYILSTIHSLTN